MHLTRFPPVFLLFVWLQATFAHVESPFNVSLHCHNLQNILEWSYSDPLPGLEFRVDIHSLTSPPQNLSVHPPTMQADVSFLSDPSSAYYLTVTAVIGQNESQPAPPDGITFSYFMNSQAKQKCSVDFPPLNVTADQDDHVLLHFTHPQLFYHNRLPSSLSTKPTKKKRHDPKIITPLPEFLYKVVVINQFTTEWFTCETRLCERKLPVDPAKEKHCLTVTGEMQKILVQSTQEYCAIPLKVKIGKDYLNIIFIVVGLFVLIAVAVVLYLVYKRKTRPSNSSVRSLKFVSQLKQWTPGGGQAQVLVPEAVPTSPTPLLLNTKEKEGMDSSPTDSSLTDPNLHPPTVVLAEDEMVLPEDEDMFDVVEMVNGEEPGYMKGSLDGDELSSSDVPSGYEKR